MQIESVLAVYLSAYPNLQITQDEPENSGSVLSKEVNGI